jgi:copper(I)-binding protein
MPIFTSQALPQREIPQGLTTMPSVAADVTTTDSWITQITLANKTAGAVTVTITDKATPAKTLLGATSIGANTTYVVAFPDAVKMNGGINWVASSASAIDAEIKGYYRG